MQVCLKKKQNRLGRQVICNVCASEGNILVNRARM